MVDLRAPYDDTSASLDGLEMPPLQALPASVRPVPLTADGGRAAAPGSSGSGGAAGATQEELLRLVREQAALDPTALEQHPPYFFRAQISNSHLDAYFTRMADSTLRNYAADAAAGVPFQNSHNTRALGFGRSLTGRYIGKQGNGVARVEADFFTTRGINLAGFTSDDWITALQLGIVRDVSVGFSGGRTVCSICGGDMDAWAWLFRDDDRDACFHVPGETYPRKGPDGKPLKGELDTATGTIEDAHLVEVSTVYRGATPGAAVLKAARMADAGLVPPDMARRLETRFRIALPQSHHAWSGWAGWRTDESEQRAEWTAAFVNNLPDAAFAGIEPGGKKDDDGKTTPRSLRHLPHHTASVKSASENSSVDVPHLRNALARVEQMDAGGAAFRDKCRSHLNAHAKALGVGDDSKKGSPMEDTRTVDEAQTRTDPEQEAPEVQTPEQAETRSTPVAVAAAVSTLALPDVRAALTAAGAAEDSEPLAAIRQLGDELRRLRPLADDGRAYRTDLIGDALRQGTRAFGEDFAAETYRGVLEHADLATIKRMRDDWQKLGDRLGTTAAQPRRTKDTEPEPATNGTATVTRLPVPDAAYRAG